MKSRFRILLAVPVAVMFVCPATAQTNNAAPPPPPPPPPVILTPTVHSESGDNEALSKRIHAPMLLISSTKKQDWQEPKP
jgi:hypothetical protein